ncbi:hypothetical protein [Spiroplasma endosymbiont of Agriotes lineatus]|uniref:hypothetical protein n=1 Tax=Spiroplasma endosymbiont of Agriotes lineatus TaxID=3077930 RepID=UPI0030D1271D
MFMKIFTVLIISFNNIFTIPQNINNDKTTTLDWQPFLGQFLYRHLFSKSNWK